MRETLTLGVYTSENRSQYILSLILFIVILVLDVMFLSTYPTSATVESVFEAQRQDYRSEDRCSLFRESEDGSVPDNITIHMSSFYGRLGNRLTALSHMIGVAETERCHVSLPGDVLPGWSTSHRIYSAVKRDTRMLQLNDSDSHSRSGLCMSRDGEFWFRHKTNSTCHLHLLMRRYFAINSTHSFGKRCQTNEYTALHIRSGDVTSGDFDMLTETYVPNKVNHNYGLFPTSYYLSVIDNVRSRRGVDWRIMVFCEDLSNPTCEFFRKVSSIDNHVELRIGQDLVSDLHLMLCGSEIAESRGSFNAALELSVVCRMKHTFVGSEPNSCKNGTSYPVRNQHKVVTVAHWIEPALEASKYENLTKFWKNTGYQRSQVNAFRGMNSCELQK